MSDQSVDSKSTDAEDLDAELADFDAVGADRVIVGEGAFVVYDDETGETRLLVPVVIDENGATTDVHVPLDARAMTDLVAGIKEARSAQRRLEGLPPLERATTPADAGSDADYEDGFDDDRRPWTRWTAGRRGVDPAGLTALSPPLRNSWYLWLLIAAVVTSFIAAIAL